jgi:hypothetical protein
MAAVVNDPGGRKLHRLAHNKALRRRRYLDGTHLRVGATSKWQDNTNEPQHLKAITSGHPQPPHSPWNLAEGIFGGVAKSLQALYTGSIIVEPKSRQQCLSS